MRTYHLHGRYMVPNKKVVHGTGAALLLNGNQGVAGTYTSDSPQPQISGGALSKTISERLSKMDVRPRRLGVSKPANISFSL